MADTTHTTDNFLLSPSRLIKGGEDSSELIITSEDNNSELEEQIQIQMSEQDDEVYEDEQAHSHANEKKEYVPSYQVNDDIVDIQCTPRTNNESDIIILNLVETVDDEGNFNIDKNTDFCSELNDGSSFKSMIEFMLTSTGCSTIDLYVTEEGMQFIGKDPNNTILVKTDLRKGDMLSHTYISDKPFYYTQLGLTIKQCISCITKKSGLRIYKDSDSDYIYLAANSGSTSGENVGMIKPPDVYKITKPLIPEYVDEDDATCKIPTSVFSARCNDASKGSHKSVTLTSYASGWMGLATGLVDDGVGTSGRFSAFGEKVDDDEAVSKITIKKKTLKSLTKILAMAPSGIIKIYLDDDNPLKILGNIGHYGQIRIYIKRME